LAEHAGFDGWRKLMENYINRLQHHHIDIAANVKVIVISLRDQ
jgi:hypothetical protein